MSNQFLDDLNFIFHSHRSYDYPSTSKMAAVESSDKCPQVLNIKSTFTTILDLPPSCIFQIPRPDKGSPDLFIIGTYHLEKDEGVSDDIKVGTFFRGTLGL
jgi:hypothetical protein